MPRTRDLVIFVAKHKQPTAPSAAFSSLFRINTRMEGVVWFWDSVCPWHDQSSVYDVAHTQHLMAASVMTQPSATSYTAPLELINLPRLLIQQRLGSDRQQCWRPLLVMLAIEHACALGCCQMYKYQDFQVCCPPIMCTCIKIWKFIRTNVTRTWA